MKLPARKKPKSTRTKHCTSKLREKSVKDDFVIPLANRYEVLYNVDDDNNMTEVDLEEDWRRINEMYTSTCEEVLGKVMQARKKGMDERRYLETC